MFRLAQLLEKIDYEVVKGSLNTVVTDVAIDSRKVVPGSLFICISGYSLHRWLSEESKPFKLCNGIFKIGVINNGPFEIQSVEQLRCKCVVCINRFLFIVIS